ncbi:MAG: glycosyltransferase family 2 protein, partial [Candidatus Methanospirareceae archaeon]
CSEDATAEIARSYGARVIVKESTIGMARHIGTVKATSPFILQTDADARIPPEWVERHLKHLQRYYVVTGSVEQPYDSAMAHFNLLFHVTGYYTINLGLAAVGANMSYRRSAYVGFPNRSMGEDVVFIRKMVATHGLDKHKHDMTLKVFMRFDPIDWVKRSLDRGELEIWTPEAVFQHMQQLFSIF